MAQTISSDQYSQPEKLYGAAAPWRGIKLPFVFLLCIAGGLAQEKSPSFMVRTVELRDWKYTCTVLTEDGRLRREGQPNKPRARRPSRRVRRDRFKRGHGAGQGTY